MKPENNNEATTERVVEFIEATKPLNQMVAQTETRKTRVAAYARVSTEQEEQQNSYEAQVDYYTNFIRKNPGWEFIGVFADRGITGTSTKNRDEFNRMVKMALSGGIDLILTKSISRFARNTVDTLQTVRELKAVGVEVQFEKEHLHTFDPKCEMMLTIMSSLAQEESRSISENVRWGWKKRMRDGKISIAYAHFLGYRKGSDGRPEIVEEEARIVRRIYEMFLSGESINDIASRLTAEEIPTPSGKKRWSVSTVNSILRNEKYKGEALLQKTFTADYLSKKVQKNNGELPSVRVHNSHEAIIQPEVFDKVQKLLCEQKKRRKRSYGTHPFAGKIFCGECGSVYGHKVWRLRSTGEHYNVWYCNHKYDEVVCQTERLREDEVKKLFEKMLVQRGEEETGYSDERWREMVQRVTVQTDGNIDFLLWNGAHETIVP